MDQVKKFEILIIRELQPPMVNQKRNVFNKCMQMTNNVSKSLVSIITPSYNSTKYISETIESVLAQTYTNWEMLIVDDCSTDNTVDIIKDFTDLRIRYIQNQVNSGAAVSRTRAINEAKGDWIAFLDSDDLWLPNKLEKQISFMEAHNYNITCTAYNKIDENGNSLKKIVSAKKKSDYNGVLRKCPGNSTVIYNAKDLGKFVVPNIKRRNDYVLFLQILKKEKYLYGIPEVLGYHRVRKGSLSANKSNLIKYHWKVYRDIEKLSFSKSVYLVFYWIFMKMIGFK